MSSIDFARLTSERPDLADAWSKLLVWIEKHPRVPLFDPRRIAREMRGDPGSLQRIAAALDVMAREGFVSPGFTVEEPGGGLYEEELFDSPNDIPESLFDRYERPFPTSEQPIIPVYARQFSAAGSGR